MLKSLFFLMFVFVSYGMDNQRVSTDVIAQRIESLYKKPWYTSFTGDAEYKKTKLIVIDYLKRIEHNSHDRDEAQKQKIKELEDLLSAAQKRREEIHKDKGCLTGVSKVKIGIGIVGCLFGLSDMVGSTIFVSEGVCTDPYKSTSDFARGFGMLSTSAVILYNGFTNDDAKAKSGRSANIERLLLQKYKDITSLPAQDLKD